MDPRLEEIDFRPSPQGAAIGGFWAFVWAFGQHDWKPRRHVSYSALRYIAPRFALGAAVGGIIGRHNQERFHVTHSYWSLKPFVPETESMEPHSH